MIISYTLPTSQSTHGHHTFDGVLTGFCLRRWYPASNLYLSSTHRFLPDARKHGLPSMRMKSVMNGCCVFLVTILTSIFGYLQKSGLWYPNRSITTRSNPDPVAGKAGGWTHRSDLVSKNMSRLVPSGPYSM